MNTEITYAACLGCRTKHRCRPGTDDIADYMRRHEKPGCRTKLFAVPDYIEELSENSSVLEAFGTAGTFTIANANLASSATAGWMSNTIDNTTNLYLDYLIQIELAAVNTAPASNQAIYLFAFGITDPANANFTSTGDGTPTGSEGTLTYPNVASLPIVAPILGTIPYGVQNRAINGGPFSIARCFGGVCPPKFCIGMVNLSGMTLSVTAIRYRGVYNTVA
jgi:hypothetical protein